MLCCGSLRFIRETFIAFKDIFNLWNIDLHACKVRVFNTKDFFVSYRVLFMFLLRGTGIDLILKEFCVCFWYMSHTCVLACVWK